MARKPLTRNHIDWSHRGCKSLGHMGFAVQLCIAEQNGWGVATRAA
jgi:hypothetical protein